MADVYALRQHSAWRDLHCHQVLLEQPMQRAACLPKTAPFRTLSFIASVFMRKLCVELCLSFPLEVARLHHMLSSQPG